MIPSSFQDELTKIAGFSDWWNRFTDLFRSEDSKAKRQVDFHFSPGGGQEKWNKFVKRSANPSFISELRSHKLSDPKTMMHAESMRDLQSSPAAGKIESSTRPGLTFEIKNLGYRLGCSCEDWRYRASVNPGYDCKHIQAHKLGKTKA